MTTTTTTTLDDQSAEPLPFEPYLPAVIRPNASLGRLEAVFSRPRRHR